MTDVSTFITFMLFLKQRRNIVRSVRRCMSIARATAGLLDEHKLYYQLPFLSWLFFISVHWIKIVCEIIIVSSTNLDLLKHCLWFGSVAYLDTFTTWSMALYSNCLWTLAFAAKDLNNQIQHHITNANSSTHTYKDWNIVNCHLRYKKLHNVGLDVTKALSDIIFVNFGVFFLRICFTCYLIFVSVQEPEPNLGEIAGKICFCGAYTFWIIYCCSLASDFEDSVRKQFFLFLLDFICTH